MSGRVLMIAFHYPPAYGSGVQRSLAFTRHLRELGWDPTVLTVNPAAHEVSSDDRLRDVPRDVRAVRAWGLDSAQHLALFGRYFPASALPDRWVTWWIGAMWAGLRLCRTQRPDLIFSTFPIATAHLIGRSLHRWTGVPWIAEFRDPMAQDDYPRDPRVWRSYKRVEEVTVQEADSLIFTTQGAVDYYRQRYPEVPADRFTIITNGYDEEVFSEVELARCARPRDERLVLVHSGLLYPWERDPRPFFEALVRLRKSGFWQRHPLKVVLRASGFEEHYRRMLAEFDVGDLVELAPRSSYRHSIAEMLDADGLLLFQAGNSNFQIPAKTYEYLRSGRPILAIVDPRGDTANLLRETGEGTIVPISDPGEIATGLERFVEVVKVSRNASRKTPSDMAKYSRIQGTRELARVFEEAVARSAK